MSLQSIWVIGDWRQPDFEEPVAWLRTHFDCQFFESPLAIGADSRDSPYPQAIVFVQSRPGKFAADEVEMLHDFTPSTLPGDNRSAFDASPSTSFTSLEPRSNDDGPATDLHHAEP